MNFIQWHSRPKALFLYVFGSVIALIAMSFEKMTFGEVFFFTVAVLMVPFTYRMSQEFKKNDIFKTMPSSGLFISGTIAYVLVMSAFLIISLMMANILVYLTTVFSLNTFVWMKKKKVK